MTGYQNPVIPGFHPDPSVCRTGDEYFLVTPMFIQGIPIFRPTNRVDWTQSEVTPGSLGSTTSPVVVECEVDGFF